MRIPLTVYKYRGLKNNTLNLNSIIYMDIASITIEGWDFVDEFSLV